MSDIAAAAGMPLHHVTAAVSKVCVVTPNKLDAICACGKRGCPYSTRGELQASHWYAGQRRMWGKYICSECFPAWAEEDRKRQEAALAAEEVRRAERERAKAAKKEATALRKADQEIVRTNQLESELALIPRDPANLRQALQTITTHVFGPREENDWGQTYRLTALGEAYGFDVVTQAFTEWAHGVRFKGSMHYPISCFLKGVKGGDGEHRREEALDKYFPLPLKTSKTVPGVTGSAPYSPPPAPVVHQPAATAVPEAVDVSKLPDAVLLRELQKRQVVFQDTSRMDLRHHVLAENIAVRMHPEYPALVEAVEFDFLCPRCGRRHWHVERNEFRNSLFSVLGLGPNAPCGAEINVRFPWAKTPARDERSVFAKRVAA